jgi:hypothetical protein
MFPRSSRCPPAKSPPWSASIIKILLATVLVEHTGGINSSYYLIYFLPVVTAAGATQEDRRLAIDQLAAEAGEDRWPIDQARPLLLAALGGESSHVTLVWSHAGQDRSAALASGVGEPPTRPDFKRRAGRGGKGVAGIGRERGRFVLCHSQKW